MNKDIEYFLKEHNKNLVAVPNILGRETAYYLYHTYGSAEVATILGKNNFPGGSRLDLYLDRTGHEREPVSERMLFGLTFEKCILDHWEEHYMLNDKRYLNEMVVYNKNDTSFNRAEGEGHFDFLRATPDAITYDLIQSKVKRIIDVKNMDKYYESSWEEAIPEYYQVQAQLYMAILNVNEFLFVCCFGGNKMKEYHLRRDGRSFNITNVAQQVKAFQEKYINTETEPMGDFEHPHYGKALARLKGQDYVDKNAWDLKEITLEEEIILTLDKSKRLMDLHKRKYDAIRAYICQILLSNETYEMNIVGSKKFKKALLKESPTKGYYVILK